MKSRFLAFWLSGFIPLAACDQGPAGDVTEVQVPAAAAPTFAPGAIAAAKAAIAAEPKVKNVVVDEAGPIEWQVGVLDDGSPRFGYAGYICLVLREHDVVGPTTDVRIVDAPRVAQGAEPAKASLGGIRCLDEARLDDAPGVGKV